MFKKSREEIMNSGASARIRSTGSQVNEQRSRDGNHNCIFTTYMLFLDKLVSNKEGVVEQQLCKLHKAACIPFPKDLRTTAKIVVEAIDLYHHCIINMELSPFEMKRMEDTAISEFMKLIGALAAYPDCGHTLFEDGHSKDILAAHHSGQSSGSDMRTLRDASQRQMMTLSTMSTFSRERAKSRLAATQAQQPNDSSDSESDEVVHISTISRASQQSRSSLITSIKGRSNDPYLTTPSKRPLEGTPQMSSAKRHQPVTPQQSQLELTVTPKSFDRHRHGFDNRDVTNYRNQFRDGEFWCTCPTPRPATFGRSTKPESWKKGYWSCGIPYGTEHRCGFFIWLEQLNALRRHLNEPVLKVNDGGREDA